MLRERKRKRKREKYQLAVFCRCPDQKLNWQPLVAQDDTKSTDPLLLLGLFFFLEAIGTDYGKHLKLSVI